MTREESQSAGLARPVDGTRLARRGRETVLSVLSVVRSRSYLTFDLASQSPSTGKFHRSSTSETPHRGGGHHVPSEDVSSAHGGDAARERRRRRRRRRRRGRGRWFRWFRWCVRERVRWSGREVRCASAGAVRVGVCGARRRRLVEASVSSASASTGRDGKRRLLVGCSFTQG